MKHIVSYGNTARSFQSSGADKGRACSFSPPQRRRILPPRCITRRDDHHIQEGGMMADYDAGSNCSGYSCCKREPGSLMWCNISHRYIGRGSLACDDHLISWDGLAKKRAEEKKRLDHA